MSRYELAGNEPRYQLTIGFDLALPLPSLFGGAEDDLAEDDGPLVWVGSSVPPLLDLAPVVAALAPYGRVPLQTQLALLQEVDTHHPLPCRRLCTNLVQIVEQDPQAPLPDLPAQAAEGFALLDAQGWRWSDLP